MSELEFVEKTVIVQTRGRAWFTCLLSGFKAQLAIDAVTADLPVDSIVRFRGEDRSTRSSYGSTLRFVAHEILEVRDAAPARAAAAERREAEKWVGYAERDLVSAKGVTNAMHRAIELAGDHPELAARVQAISDAMPAMARRAQLAGVERYLGWAETQVADGLTTSRSIDTALTQGPEYPELAQRMQALRARISANHAERAEAPTLREVLLAEAYPTGTPVKFGRAWVVFVDTLRRRRIDEDGPSIWGGHLLGHEGDLGVVMSYRTATADEIAQGEQADAEHAATKKAQDAANAAAKALFTKIQTEGDRPAGHRVPSGERVFGGPNLYGGGRWVEICDDTIWAVTNNGADGDSWGINNVLTGGAGAIGWRVPRTPHLEQEIRELSLKGAQL